MSTRLAPSELEARLRRIGAERYHSRHAYADPGHIPPSAFVPAP